MEGTIQQLFEGHHMNYIECINVDYKSTRKESFYGIVLYNCTLLSYYTKPTFLSIYHVLISYLMADLQLDVKGCKDVYASFDKYVEVERLEGDNKYHAEGHGLQVGCPHSFHFTVWDGRVIHSGPILVPSNSFLSLNTEHIKRCGYFISCEL